MTILRHLGNSNRQTHLPHKTAVLNKRDLPPSLAGFEAGSLQITVSSGQAQSNNVCNKKAVVRFFF